MDGKSETKQDHLYQESEPMTKLNYMVIKVQLSQKYIAFVESN